MMGHARFTFLLVFKRLAEEAQAERAATSARGSVDWNAGVVLVGGVFRGDGGRETAWQEWWDSGLNRARGHTVEIFEIAGEMGELLVTEIVCDALDSLATLEAGIGEVQAHFAKTFADGDLIMLDEVALECAEGNTASVREQGGAEV